MRGAMNKTELRREVHDFCAAFMYEFLRQEIGFVPSLDTYIRKLTWAVSVLDLFSADELRREFLIYSGLGEGVFAELNMEFPADFMTEIGTGSEEGLLRWLKENVEKLCRDEGVTRLWVAERLPSGWLLILENAGLTKGEVIEWLEEQDVEVNRNRMSLFRVGELPKREDEKWQDLLAALSQWRTKAVDVYVYEEGVEEGVLVKVKDLLTPLYEAISIDALYRGAYQYMREQPGVTDRVEKGEILKSSIFSLRFRSLWRARELRIDAEVKSETDPVAYPAVVVVQDMDFSEEFDEWTPIKVLDAETHEEFYMRFIEQDDMVRVNCGCEDFRCRFAPILKRMTALQGRATCPPRRTTRKSINVARVPSACKHIFAVFEALIDAGVIVTRAYPRAREIDLTKGLVI
jgi:hypothetical protein